MASFVLLGIGVLLVWVVVLIASARCWPSSAAKVIGTPVATAFKVTGRMAQGNAARNPKRTARAAAPADRRRPASPLWHCSPRR